MPLEAILIEELKSLMVETLVSSFSLTPQQASVVADEFIDAEIQGKSTHGVGKFLTIAPAAMNRGAPTVGRDIGAVVTIDANRELGFLIATTAATLAAERARKYGIAVVAVSNFSRYSRLKPYVKQIASAGVVGVVLNGGGPPAVVPPGATGPILGTNPIAFGFPVNSGGPVLVDFATSQAVWGEIRKAILSEGELPADSFLDSQGKVTRDPNLADGVLPFGGFKGYALGLAIELLAAMAPGAEVGADVDSEYDLGALFIAINPASLDENFPQKVERLKRQLQAVNATIPGERSTHLAEEAIKKGVVDIDSDILRQLRAMRTGASADLRIDDKTN